MANTENINRLIDHLKAQGGQYFRMSSFATYIDGDPGDYCDMWVECGTALCLAGTANLLRLQDNGVDYKTLVGEAFDREFTSERDASFWLDINVEHETRLFFMTGSSQDGFDELPDDIRLRAGIRVLEILRDENRVAWGEAIGFAQGGSDA